MDDIDKVVNAYSQFSDVKYHYTKAVLEDVEQFLDDNSEYIIKHLKETDYDSAIDNIMDNLRDEDSITGNASGSYTYNRFKAKACVLSIIDDVPDIFDALGDSPDHLNKLISDANWEAIDVTIRYYKFHEVYQDIVDMINDKFPEEFISED